MSEIKEVVVKAFARTTPENLPTFYANNVEIRTTQWDLRFSFGQITSMTSDGVVHVKDQVEIYLSPQHAKVFLQVLKGQVESYESKIGPIPTTGESQE